jgi:hypothetical protein
MPQYFDPSFYRHCEGCVGIMSWRRGGWENAILDSVESPQALQSFLEAFHETANVTVH